MQTKSNSLGAEDIAPNIGLWSWGQGPATGLQIFFSSNEKQYF